MRGDGVDVARSIGGDAFEVVKLPEIAVTPRPERGAQGRVTDVVASDTKETQRMLLFVLDNEKAAVGELLDAGRLVGPGQGLKDRGSGVERSGCHFAAFRRSPITIAGATGAAQCALGRPAPAAPKRQGLSNHAVDLHVLRPELTVAPKDRNYKGGSAIRTIQG